jgi:hypothetical protein
MLWSLITFTSGAWDRLMLGFSGSLFSSVLTARKSIKNLYEATSLQQHFVENIGPNLEAALLNRVTPAAGKFADDLKGAFNLQADNTGDQVKPLVRLHGINELSQRWKQLLDDQVSASQHRWAQALGFLSLLVFWFLFGGPLVHLYGQFAPAAWRSFTGLWQDGILDLYPSVPLTFLAGSAMLGLIPAFLVGIVVFAWICRRKRSRALLRSLKHSLVNALDQGEIPFHATLESLKLQAADTLMRLTEAGPRS